MTYRGHIKNGEVVLDAPVALPDGATVEVSVREVPVAGTGAESAETLLDVLGPVVGRATGLPADAAENHDHYLYGVPKRK